MTEEGALLAASGPHAGARESGSAARADSRRPVSSGVRLKDRAVPAARAADRVEAYLRALGLRDEARLTQLGGELLRAAEGEDDPLPQALDLAQRRGRDFARAIGEGEPVDPLFLRHFARVRPDLFWVQGPGLTDARAAAHALGDPTSGRIRGESPVVEAELSTATVSPMRRVVRACVALAALMVSLSVVAAGHGAWVMGTALVACAALLWAQGLASLAMVTAGALAVPRRRSNDEKSLAAAGPLPPTAILMPVYHEDPSRVLAAAAAMRDALVREPSARHFELFVLSDSRDPARAAEEERALRRVAPGEAEAVPIHYRRRARNDLKKTGNIAEFLERWGERFEFAIVLDADSLVRGETLLEMTRRMVADPRLGLLQAPIMPRGAQTLFARWQQFSAWLIGPLATRGLRAFAGDEGNYFGHNAIVRVRAFIDCCGLPSLPGEGPLAGPILSHDFVEAALLVRAGWKVVNAPDLEGSYEELPPTLSAFVERDRRWCQGNLQHLRLVRSAGLSARSRVHLISGAMGYLAAPLWAVFLTLALGLSAWAPSIHVARMSAWMLGAAALMLFLLAAPRVLGAARAWLDADVRRAHGGGLRLALSTLAELLVGALVAPIYMALHTRIVLGILAGHGSSWQAQARDAGSSVAEARARVGTSLLGVLLALVTAAVSTDAFAWLAPVWAPLLLAPALAAALASTRAGALAERWGLFVSPPETRGEAVADRAAERRVQLLADDAGRFRDLVLDPTLYAIHVAQLQASSAEPVQPAMVERALRAGPAAISAEERALLASDPDAMARLHRGAWCSWPLEHRFV